jgi:hypothetical protein
VPQAINVFNPLPETKKPEGGDELPSGRLPPEGDCHVGSFLGFIACAAVVGGLFCLVGRLIKKRQDSGCPRGGASSEPGGFYTGAASIGWH